MRKTVGVLPMAGSGSRLGMPFPKPLSPTFTKDGIKPLYRHSYDLMIDAGVTEVFGVVAAEDLMNWHGFETFPILPRPIRGSATGTVRWASTFIEPEDDMLVMLPDTIVRGDVIGDRIYMNPVRDFILEHSFTRERMSVGIVNSYDTMVDAFYESGDTPRTVITLVEKKEREYGIPIRGWAMLLGPSPMFRRWDSESSFVDNIQGEAWRPIKLKADFRDLGTPERYMDYMDTRKW